MTTHIVSFSGGRTSAFLVHLMEKRRQAGENVHYVFMDTGGEHPKTYEFVRNVARVWGIPLVCLRVIPDPEKGKASTYEVVSIDDIGPDYVPWFRMVSKYGAPYNKGPFCTDRMKTVPFTKYCQEHFGKGNYQTWLGMRVDEPKRVRVRKGFSYLADISDFDKQDILEWWKAQPFDLDIPEHLGNCVFCIKKNTFKLALAIKDDPDSRDKFMDMLCGATWQQTKHPIMYRGNHSFKSLIAWSAEHTREELLERVLSARMYDTNSCTESCEAHGNDTTDEE